MRAGACEWRDWGVKLDSSSAKLVWRSVWSALQLAELAAPTLLDPEVKAGLLLEGLRALLCDLAALGIHLVSSREQMLGNECPPKEGCAGLTCLKNSSCQ